MTTKQPPWIDKPLKADNNYYYGKVVLDKPLPKDYQQVARSKVHEQIASQILVSVVSSIKRVISKSKEGVVSDFGESITVSRVEEVLPLLEIEDYEDEDSYYVYGKLKKKENIVIKIAGINLLIIKKKST